MRTSLRFFLGTLLLCFVASFSFAQTPTLVTGTIKDTNGVPYSFAKVSAQLIPSTASPTVIVNGIPAQIGGQQNANADVNGNFTMNLFCNSAGGGCSVISPPGTQWQITVNENGVLPPLGTGPQACTATLTITGSSQSVSSSFSACPAIETGAPITTLASIPGQPGLNAVPITSGLLAEYRILPTETPSGLIDYSGNGRNATGTVGTAPTTIPATGGIQCNANGAVAIPASVNTARDIFVYVGFQTNFTLGGPAIFSSPIMANGNGGTANSAGLTVANYQLANQVSNHVSDIVPAAAANPTLFTLQGVNGNHLIEWDMDTVDHVFLDGQEAAYNLNQATPTSSAGFVTVGNYQLCGAAAGSGLGTVSYFNGQLYYAVAYNRVLNPAERAQVTNYMMAAMANRGVPVLQQITVITGDTAMFSGDSITGAPLGSAATTWTDILQLTGITNTVNNGFSGSTATQAATAGSQLGQAFFQKTAQRNVVMLWYCTNDFASFSISASGCATQLASAIKSHTSYGHKVLLATMVSRTCAGCDAFKNSLNAILRQNWRAYGASGLVDVAADPNLGADGAFGNTVYFNVDGIHPNKAGAWNDISGIAQRAVNRLYGNTDLSTAVVYSSAAAAAVATTAGSEAGNTVTITFAATPANCQVGNRITITGTTPAGYTSTTANGAGPGNTWTILTRSATQITYWNNTTGLGAITVQGTGVCPQSQDADQVAILNFGAGNHTLDSAVGYTGQCITRQNINAAASTLVPLGTETITGAGATPTTLAANTTAVLCSQLVSAAAAGANWVRVQ